MPSSVTLPLRLFRQYRAVNLKLPDWTRWVASLLPVGVLPLYTQLWGHCHTPLCLAPYIYAGVQLTSSSLQPALYFHADLCAGKAHGCSVCTAVSVVSFLKHQMGITLSGGIWSLTKRRQRLLKVMSYLQLYRPWKPLS